MLFESHSGEKTDNDLLIQMDYIPETFTGSIIRNAIKFYYENEYRGVFSQMIAIPSFKIWDHAIIVHQDGALYPTTHEAGLKLHFMLSDAHIKAVVRNEQDDKVIAEKAGTAVELQSGEMILVNLPQGKHDAPIQKGAYNFFHLDLGPSVLVHLERNPKAIPLLLAIKAAKHNGKIQINDTPITISIYCKSLIEQIRQHTYSGKVSEIYLRKKCWQLLDYFIKEFSIQKSAVIQPLTPQDVNMLDTVKAAIKLQLHESFNTQTLSRNFNIPAKTLAHNFHQFFDSTIKDFTQNYKMEQAFKRLVKTNIPLNKLAQLLGYKHTGSFTRAFHAYWGYKPAYLRQLKSNTL